MGVRPPQASIPAPAWTTAQIELTILPVVVTPALAPADSPTQPGDDAVDVRDLRRTIRVQSVERSVRSLVDAALNQAGTDQLLRHAGRAETPDFEVREQQSTINLCTRQGIPIIALPRNDSRTAAALLAHAARYLLLSELDRQLAPGALTGKLTLTVSQGGPATKGGPRHRPLPTFGTTAYAPVGMQLNVAVRNDASEPVAWVLLDLAPDYSVTLLAGSHGSTGKLMHGQESAQNLEVFLPDGFVQETEHLLLLASTREIDFSLLAMPAIGDNVARSSTPVPVGSEEVIDALLAAAAASPFNVGQAAQDDAWTAMHQSFLVVQPPEQVTRPFAAGSVEFVEYGVTCQLPTQEMEGGTATARILTAEQAAIFAAGVDVLPPMTPPGLGGNAIDPPNVIGWSLSSDHGRVLGTGVDLHLPRGWSERVNNATPLRIHLTSMDASIYRMLAEQAGFAVGSNGQFYFPAGRLQGDSFAITNWVDTDDFVRLQFYGLTGDAQLMAPGLYAAEFAPYTSTSPQVEPGTRQLTDGMLRYAPATPTHLAPGSRVALAVHGYGGSSDAIAHWLLTRNAPLGLGYDQVLAFHYDSLDTALAENARLLQELLRRAGAGPDDDVQIDLFAHGTGGLLARWLVEVDGGNAIIDRCVLAGTPHDGWHMATSDTYGYWLMLLELNLSHPWRPTLVPQWAAGRNLETGPALAELAPDSEFLRRLAAHAERTALPYLHLAGDAGRSAELTALLAALAPHFIEASRLDELRQGDGMTAAASADALLRARRGAANLTVEAVHVTYFHYFADAAVEAAIVRWLRAGESRAE